jgi:acyl-CoA thioester hydrolase
MPDQAVNFQDATLWLHHAAVRPEWVDYNGHMSEAYYVLVFGEATDAFYDYVGLNDAFRRGTNVSVYTTEGHIRYLQECHEGECLLIGTRIMSVGPRALRLHHAMLRERDRALLAVTEIMALHVDKASLRACPFHPDRLAAIEAVARTQAALPPPHPATSRHWGA